jgi:hypothetical protein
VNPGGRSSYRAFLPVLLAASLLAAAADRGEAGLRFGGRIGYTDFDGQIFDGSRDLGKVDLIGIQVLFPLVPRIELELAGEGARRNLDFRELQGTSVDGRARWDDLALYASLRLHLPLVASGLLGWYVGGGAGVHFTQLDIQTAEQVDDALAESIRDLERDRSKPEWNALAGLSLGLGAAPLEIFAEGRYRDITGDHGPQGFGAYGGLNLKLP